MEYYQPPPHPLTLGLGAAAAAILWGLGVLLLAAPIASLAVRAISARRAAPVTDLGGRSPLVRLAIVSVVALILGGVGVGLLTFGAFGAPVAAADTTEYGSEAGLQRCAIATKRAVVQAFPQVEQIGGFRPDPYGEHDDGTALDVLIPGDPASPQGVELGDAIRDFLLARAGELGVDHIVWRQHVYRADGTSEPMRDRGSEVANHLTHLHVSTKGGGCQ